MIIAVELRRSGIVGDFLKAFAQTASRLGYEVSRNPKALASRKDAISVVWNGRNHRSAGPTLYCEHGWLPRWEYQISHQGINADSNFAPFQWDGKPLTQLQKEKLKQHTDKIRYIGPENRESMQTNLDTVRDLPDNFILVPIQMQLDTNIQRHVPPRFQHMQAFLDYVSQSSPPYPIIFKQHPSDSRRGNQQLRLRLRRKQDMIRPHNAGNIHQILKSGCCKGIIALNSNVVHDGLVWDVPAIVLGKNIWPRSGKSPFLNHLPQDWEELFNFFAKSENQMCREAYMYFLMEIQWKFEDIQDDKKVDTLLKSVTNLDYS